MTLHKAVKQFLAVHTVQDVKAEVFGELNEYATDEASFAFGNRELLVWIGDDDEAYVLHVDSYGDRDILVA